MVEIGRINPEICSPTDTNTQIDTLITILRPGQRSCSICFFLLKLTAKGLSVASNMPHEYTVLYNHSNYRASMYKHHKLNIK